MNSGLLAFDRDHLWHPYGSMDAPSPVWQAVGAEGVTISLADGTRLIDGISSWWCAAHGHRHPAIMAAIRSQLENFDHVMFAGFTHAPAVELARLLLETVPAGLEKVFFSDSGSVAVEVALKMALQYQFAAGHPERRRFFTLRGGYHGDTLGTMALSDPEGMHGCFAGAMPPAVLGAAPECAFHDEWDDRFFAPIAEELEKHRREIAAVIVEPVFQGGSAMRFFHPMYLKRLREACDRFGILLILDEIATGFGRTGRFFAAGYAGISPDIMTVGKALTGGAITLAATLATARVAHGVGRLMHGPTFMANPLACAAGCASLDLFASGAWQNQVAAIETQLRTDLEPLRGLPGVTDVRVLGAIGVVELSAAPDPGKTREILHSSGVWLRPLGRWVYAMPPFVIAPAELKRVTGAMRDIASL